MTWGILFNVSISSADTASSISIKAIASPPTFVLPKWNVAILIFASAKIDPRDPIKPGLSSLVININVTH